MRRTYKDISTYGLIGNGETCALVGRDGSVDWLCFPYLESPSVFGALLDAGRGGEFSITPEMRYASSHAYLGTTNILQTEFFTPTGNVKLTDFMPAQQDGARRMLVRKVEGTKGTCWLKVAIRPRFNYGRTRPVLIRGENGLRMQGGSESMFLGSPPGFVWKVQGDDAEGTLAVGHDQVFWFVLAYGEETAAGSRACASLLDREKAYWQGWVDKYLTLRGIFDEPWRDVIIRSGLVLKLLIRPATGAIAAAATTSLPEQVGGIRNWDYRFAWMRDSSFTIQALYHLGDVDELRGYQQWIEHVFKAADDVSKIRTIHGLHHETDLRESIIDNFSGYRDSGPVRIGNAAAEQLQLDIYGELVDGIYETSRYGAQVSPEIWEIIRSMVDHVCHTWKKPDSGIWEFRGKPRQLVYSKLMCWVAIDRAVRIARMKEDVTSLPLWLKTAKEIREAILKQGFDAGKNTFVQAFGARDIDATALKVPLLGFLPVKDPRVQGTIEAVQRELTANRCLVYRYRSDDALAGREGTFMLCSFWLIKALALSGKVSEAEELFRETFKYISPLGLFSEEIDPATGRQLGNFPQAFGHIGLINASLYIGLAKGKKRAGPPPSATIVSPVKKISSAAKTASRPKLKKPLLAKAK